MKVIAQGNHCYQLSYFGFVTHRLDQPIVRLLFRHAHVDHIGALDELHGVSRSAK